MDGSNLTAGTQGGRCEIQISDPGELSSLQRWLSRSPGLTVERAAAAPEPGQQGVWDFLGVLAGGGGVLAIAIKTLPEFIRSRRSDVTITLRTKNRVFTMTSTNVEAVVPAILKALDD